MQVFHGVQEMKGALSASVVTIGNFDGVHLGHRELISTVVRESQLLGVPGVVYTFNPHPVRILHPERPTYRLFDLKDQQEQFSHHGIKLAIVEPFSLEFSKTSAQEFFDNYILKYLNPTTLVVGHDFSFGADRQGNLQFLQKLCETHGIKLYVIPPFKNNGEIISSSKIREALKNGNIAQAQCYLGRPYYLRGHVEHGFKRGRTIGVPTANVTPDVEFVPRAGVYCTMTKVQGHEYPSITNIGVNPTFADQNKKSPIKIESHIFDFNAQLYDLEVEVRLLHFIRDEMKFSGIEELKNQIQTDMQQARKWISENA